MSFFDTLPSAQAVFNASHEDAAYMIHAWLFNAGAGVTVKDHVTGSNGTLSGTYTWEAGGGVHFTAAKMTPGSIAAASGVTIVAGLKQSSNDQTGNKTVFGWTQIVYLSTGQPWFYALSGTTYENGVQSSARLTYDVPTQVAWKTDDNGVQTTSVIGTDSWNAYLAATVAFVYIFDGEPDTLTLLGHLNANPYGMFSEPAVPVVVREHSSGFVFYG